MRKIFIFSCALIIVSCLTLIAYADSDDIEAQPGQVDPYKTRSELLMNASSYTGVFTPEQAASVWAQGLEQRSAALQYVVMTQKLKDKYEKQLNALNSNWVTGLSSPSVMGYTLTDIKMHGETHADIRLKIKVGATWDPEGEFYKAELRLVREGDFWRIERIKTDEELYPYTLYKP